MKRHLRIPLFAALAPLVVLLGCPGPVDPSDAVCGNGVVEAGEDCDDGNTAADDACDQDCTLPSPVCGNGIKEGTEQCDDGNTASGDGCEPDCTGTPGECGNGQVEGTEACDDGNATAGDGCENDCTATAFTVEECSGAPAAPQGASCEVTPGDASRVIYGTILAPGKVYVGGAVQFDAQGTIQCVGCGCDAGAATVVNCVGSVVSPGLINSHDDITFQADPFVPSSDERYEHRHDWRKGNDGHTMVSSGGSSGGAQITWAELRQIMSGTTSIAGSGGADGLLRNLDRSGSQQEGLNGPVADYETFPLGDSGGTELTDGCNYNEKAPGAGSTAAWLPHIAEGIEASARNEWLCISQSDTFKPFLSRAGIIHGIGVKASDVGQITANGSSLIWSPRSNIFLYGDTAPIPLYKRMGTRIALGTDWVRSGSMNLLRELKCADGLNRNHFGEALTDEELWRSVTSNAADLMQVGDKIGRLAQGRAADIAIFKGGSADSYYRAVIDAETDDVVLTLRGGKALYGDEAVVKALSADACETLDMCGVSKAVCVESDIGQSFSALAQANASTYPLFAQACGTPRDEPTCTPMRASTWTVNGSNAYTGEVGAGDLDGDGVADAMDSCPNVFNPIRPLDNGTQADVDQDGVGDACDVCPLDANSTTCTPVDASDTDGDGVKNDQDNCPADANPDQADMDNDGIGDACDACAAPNPGNSACPTTIYAIKNGTAPEGQKVSLGNVLVTAASSSGFFVQVHPNDNGYTGPEHSGLFVFGKVTLAAGDRIDIGEGTVTNYFGQLQLGSISGVTVVSSGNALPDPVVVSPSEVNNTGLKKDALEGVLVRVENVTVTDVNPAAGPGDKAPTNEFVITNDLRVNDYLYLVNPFPIAGETFDSITGILEWRNGNMKIEPRSDADLVAGDAVLSAFGPTGGFIREGQTNTSTMTDPLVVSISRPSATDTFVAITSSSADLTVVGGGVTLPAGVTSAAVLLNAVAQNASVTLTATLDGVSKTADVTVLGLNQPATLISLDVGAGTVNPGGSTVVTVHTDVPVPTTMTVTVSLAPAGFGSVPATVTIPQDATFVPFVLNADANASGTATLSATAGGTTLNATLTAQVGRSGLVINEIDYDMTMNPDSEEFVELYNAGGASVDLTHLALVFVNGSNSTEYRRVALNGLGATLAPGEYAVIGSDAALAKVTTSAKKLSLGAGTDLMQNGAPDGVAILDTGSATLVDALSYEGSMTSVTLDGATYSFVEGTATTALDSGDGSMVRVSNGIDTDDAATDWGFSATVTPGAANP